MRNIGFMVAGFEFGCGFVDFLTRHGCPTSRNGEILNVVMGFAVWTILTFQKEN